MRSQPDQVERILVYGNLVGQGCGIVTAQPGAAVGVDADTKIAYASLEMGVAGNVGNGSVHIVVDLRCVGNRLVVLVVEREQKDAGDQR